jgi:response regulator RpfG family c-di-GMP phosphodiesterase
LEEILLNHHERPDGKGYPNAIPGNKIPPMACVFIVAHDLVDYLQSGFAYPSIENFLKLNEKEYQAGNFRKIALALQSMQNSPGES